MQQRVLIARALAVGSDIIFMDEPLGALDAITRMKLQDDILNILRQEKSILIKCRIKQLTVTYIINDRAALLTFR